MSKKVARKRKTVTKEDGNGHEVTLPDEADSESLSNMQKELDQSVISEMLGVKDVVAGVQMRPLTLASIALLSQVKSPLIEGVVVDEIENILLEICIFITLQSCEVEEATELAFGDRSKLVAQAMKIADGIKANEVEEISSRVIQIIGESTDTQVEPIPDSNTSPEKPGEGND